MVNNKFVLFVAHLLLCLTQTTIFCQSTATFNTYFGGDEDDTGYSILQNFNRGYFVAGQTVRSNYNQTDVYLARLDSLAVPIWEKTYGGSGIDYARSIVELSDSGLVILGSTNSFGAGGYDALLIRVDKNGQLIWQKTIGGTEWEFANSLCKTLSGDLLLSGITYSNQSNKIDAFVSKVAINGDIIWTKTFGGVGDDFLNDIVQHSAGYYVAVGQTNSYGDTNGDVWVLKLSATGDTISTVRWGNTRKDVANAVVEDAAGDLLIAGSTQHTLTADENILILKLTSSLTPTWYRDYGATDKGEVAFDVLNSGSSYGSMLVLYSTEEVSGNKKDVKNILLNSGGYYIRGGSKGGTSDDVCYSMVNTKDKGYIACGYTESFNSRLRDVYVIKYDSEMTIGPLILDVRENKKNQNTTLYPTLITDNYFFVETNSNKIPEVNLYEMNGTAIKPKEIVVINNGIYKVILPDYLQGLFFIDVDKGILIRKCLIR